MVSGTSAINDRVDNHRANSVREKRSDLVFAGKVWPRPAGARLVSQETDGKELRAVLTSRLDNDGVASDYSHLQ